MLKTVFRSVKKTLSNKKSKKKQQREHYFIETPLIEQHVSYVLETELYRYTSTGSDTKSVNSNMQSNLSPAQEEIKRYHKWLAHLGTFKDFDLSYQRLTQLLTQISVVDKKEEYFSENFLIAWFDCSQTHQEEIISFLDVLNNSDLIFEILTRDFFFKLLSGFPCSVLTHLIHHLSLNNKQKMILPYWDYLTENQTVLSHINSILWSITQCYQSDLITPDLIATLLEKNNTDLSKLSHALDLIRRYYPTSLNKELLDYFFQSLAEEFFAKTIPELVAPWQNSTFFKLDRVNMMFSYYRSIFTKKRGGPILLGANLQPLVALLTQNPSYVGIAATLLENDEEDLGDSPPSPRQIPFEIQKMFLFCKEESDLNRIGYLDDEPITFHELGTYSIDEEIQDMTVFMLLRSDPAVWPEPAATNYLNTHLAYAINFLRLLSCCLLIAKQQTAAEQLEAANILSLLELIVEIVKEEEPGHTVLEHLLIQERILFLVIEDLADELPVLRELSEIFPFQHGCLLSERVESEFVNKVLACFKKTTTNDLPRLIANSPLIFYWAISTNPDAIIGDGFERSLCEFARLNLTNFSTLGTPLLLLSQGKKISFQQHPTWDCY